MDNQIINPSNELKNTECCMCHRKVQKGIVLLNLMEEWYCGECYIRLRDKVKENFKNQMKELRENA